MRIAIISVLTFLTLSFSCSKKSVEEKGTNSTHVETIPENSELYDPDYKPENDIQIIDKYERERYNPSETRINDITHTKLEVSFDYKKRHLNGKATIDVKPYYYPVTTLSLDAKGMDLHKVGMMEKGVFKPLNYTYDTLDIVINLGREFKRGELYTIYIEYTAKPDELKLGGSEAIAGDKGLYFIDPDETEETKPTQIWTQGETEASSCWFPTIDRPNEKMTHEILMTVPDKYKTLSNGLMISSVKGTNGMRTDHWKMLQPHSPYLVMMAVGDFAVVKDTWKKSNGKSIEVNYYVEPEYEQYARDIFGETPRMIEFFSKKLGVEYPWDKYSQVVVRDYVSGAMENTTATIHGEFLQRTKRELIDNDNESIIAHELFHHWFGDLATCESWANLPLNESFANYSQYLWDEFKYGNDEADYNALTETQGYFLQSRQQGHFDMIRFDYLDKEEMFDAHSYNKGGRILHMLRGIVGDEAFFESLKTYLNENQYQPAEIHHLRLAFEKVTGRDLNWFFNQWFLASGHPELKITQEYDSEAKEIKLTVKQNQDLNVFPLYQLPVEVDIYTEGGKRTEKIMVEKMEETFRFKSVTEPLLVNFDAQKTLLCEKSDAKPLSQFVYQYYNGSKFLDRYEALKECAQSNDAEARKAIITALGDKFWYLRELAIKNLKKSIKTDEAGIKTSLINLAKNDPEPSVRATAIKYLAKYFDDDQALVEVYKLATNDQSYDVMSEAFVAIATVNPEAGMDMARQHETENSSAVRDAIAQIYAEYGTEKEHGFFLNAIKKANGLEKYSMLTHYNTYLKRQSDAEIEKGIAVFEDVARNGSAWWIKLSGYQMLGSLQGHFAKRQLELQTKAESLRAEGKQSDAIIVERDQVKAREQEERIGKLIQELKSKETDPNLLQYLKQ